jgi:hypothetical protein
MADWPANGDTDWNTKMLAYLAIEHNTDGTHKATEITAVVTGEGIFGARTKVDTLSAPITRNVTYLAQSDGILTTYADGNMNSNDNIKVYQDSVKANVDGEGAAYITAWHDAGSSAGSGGYYCVTVPVIKGEYVRVETSDASAIVGIWNPIGSGGLVAQ